MRIFHLKLYFFAFILGISCTTKNKDTKEVAESIKEVKKDSIYTKLSIKKSEYLNFDSQKAINKIAEIENSYYNDFDNKISKYYGTEWRTAAETIKTKDSISLYDLYVDKLALTGQKPDSLHCTIYAYKSLKSGFSDEDLKRLENLHRKIWKDREMAGWSLGYLLVKYFNWDAYLIINENSSEYKHCLKSYKKDKTYPVWKQPNIPLKNMLIINKDTKAIDSLLTNNEFGWGFSRQGIHTWITRFNNLKECNWLGAPSAKYNPYKVKSLFIDTPFNQYNDYQSHVIIFPKKKLNID